MTTFQVFRCWIIYGKFFLDDNILLRKSQFLDVLLGFSWNVEISQNFWWVEILEKVRDVMTGNITFLW